MTYDDWKCTPPDEDGWRTVSGCAWCEEPGRDDAPCSPTCEAVSQRAARVRQRLVLRDYLARQHVAAGNALLAHDWAELARVRAEISTTEDDLAALDARLEMEV